MKNSLETKLGIFVILVVFAAWAIVETLGSTDLFTHGHHLSARFESAQDLKVGDRVKMAGVEIGRVEKIALADSKVMVTMKVRRGAYVTEMSRQDVAQVYHLLALLESDAASTVALQASPAQREQLAQLHARLASQVRRRDAFFATNEQFHMTLLQMAGNRWALQTALDLRKVMKLNRHHSLFKRGRLAESLAEHQAIMQAITAGDGVAAAALMRLHFSSGLDAAA